ncbi:MAG TPA: hypothetical protein DGG94_09325 [Micromonosporaceae bacterium]|nr:hypothetical protein [Micromonosporaceae bacterium]
MIPDEVIEGYLGMLFGNSEPGQLLHHLLVATAAPADHTALGFPQTDKLKVTIYAIAPTGDVDAGQFVAKTIRTAIVEARRGETVPYFAGLAMEVHTVDDDGNEVTENLARRLGADRKLQDHPAAVEVTLLYAACRDGRRWVGEHLLTGDRAGTVVGPEMRVGAIGPQESGTHQRLVRAAVGLA